MVDLPSRDSTPATTLTTSPTTTPAVVTCYVGVGSNLNDPQKQCQQAFDKLAALPQTVLEKKSSLYQTDPMGPADQPRYINAVAQLSTELSALELLDGLQAIEDQQGRVRGRRWGERTLDLDILLFGDMNFQSTRLTVPHPGMSERSFVLIPLLEIAPKIHIPGVGEAASCLASVSTLGIKQIAASSRRPGETDEA